MKNRIFLLLIFLGLLSKNINAQTPSDCTVPSILQTTYEEDIANLTIKRLYQVQSVDTALVEIPQQWTDTITEGMAAILNAPLPESDTVFNLYCIRDMTSGPLIYGRRLLLTVNNSYPWTDAWFVNSTTLTGNYYIDSLMTNYNISFNSSFSTYVLLELSDILNPFPLMEAFTNEPAIDYCQLDELVGGAGQIEYDKVGNIRFYRFHSQWTDCFDGCDNERIWSFKVYDDCSVDFVNAITYHYYPPSAAPLPAPQNCNTFTCSATNDSVTVVQSAVSNIFPANNDYCGSDIGIIAMPLNGTAVLETNNSITYTSNNTFIGLDSLTYSICDSLSFCDTAKVYYTVLQNINDGINTLKNSIVFYPNPAKNSLFISLDAKEKIEVSIYNTLGNKMYSDLFSKTKSINLKDFSNGVYFVIIEVDNKPIVKKLEVIK